MNVEQKIWEQQIKYTVRCTCPCKVSVVFYPFEKRTKKICRACGNYVYINEKERFKDKMKGVLK